MLFLFLRYWLSLAMRVWYRRAYVHFDAPLPTDGPIIFACTHPNSAVDYLFAPLIHRMPTYVLVRGDVFEKPLLNKVFRTIFMLPVYRFRDGFASINKNQDSFKTCYEHFDKQGRVLIFSEGICIQEKVLQPLRKGTARLALNYLAQHGGEKVYIVPISGSYTRFRHFRSSIMVNYGKAIDARAYMELYEENANKAYERLTADVEEQLRKQYITFQDYADDSSAERVMMAHRLERTAPGAAWRVDDRSVFDGEKSLSERLNAAHVDTREVLELCERTGIDPNDDGVLSSSTSPWTSLVYLMLATPIVALAALTVAFPYLMGRWIVNRWIKDIIFDNTVMVMGGTVLYVLQFAVLLIVGLSTMGWLGLALPFVVLMITMVGLEVIDPFILHWRRWKHRAHLDKLEVLAQKVRAFA